MIGNLMKLKVRGDAFGKPGKSEAFPASDLSALI